MREYHYGQTRKFDGETYSWDSCYPARDGAQQAADTLAEVGIETRVEENPEDGDKTWYHLWVEAPETPE